MKTLKFLILMVSCLAFETGASSKISERQHCLIMQGVVKQAGNDEYSSEYILDSAVIRVFNETMKTNEILYSDEFGKCNINLPFNNQFSVSISKMGYLTKIISIDTRVLGNKTKHFDFPFLIDLFEKKEALDFSYLLNEPIALVNFNYEKKEFVYQFNNSDKVNAQIRDISNEYYNSLKQIGFLSYDSALEITDQVPPEILTVQPVIPTITNTNVVYKVQIVAVVFGPLPDNNSVFLKCGKADESYSDGLYKYTIGEFHDSVTAEQKLLEMQNKGYSDAFIVTFKDGKEIPIVKTEQILEH